MRLTSVYDCPWSGDYGPKLKRPTIPRDGNVTLFTQTVSLLCAVVEMAHPRDVSWSTKYDSAEDIAEAVRAMTALHAANPKLLRLDDRRGTETPALYLMRVHDCVTFATVYDHATQPTNETRGR